MQKKNKEIWSSTGFTDGIFPLCYCLFPSKVPNKCNWNLEHSVLFQHVNLWAANIPATSLGSRGIFASTAAQRWSFITLRGTLSSFSVVLNTTSPQRFHEEGRFLPVSFISPLSAADKWPINRSHGRASVESLVWTDGRTDGRRRWSNIRSSLRPFRTSLVRHKPLLTHIFTPKHLWWCHPMWQIPAVHLA